MTSVAFLVRKLLFRVGTRIRRFPGYSTRIRQFPVDPRIRKDPPVLNEIGIRVTGQFPPRILGSGGGYWRILGLDPRIRGWIPADPTGILGSAMETHGSCRDPRIRDGNRRI